LVRRRKKKVSEKKDQGNLIGKEFSRPVEDAWEERNRCRRRRGRAQKEKKATEKGFDQEKSKGGAGRRKKASKFGTADTRNRPQKREERKRHKKKKKTLQKKKKVSQKERGAYEKKGKNRTGRKQAERPALKRRKEECAKKGDPRKRYKSSKISHRRGGELRQRDGSSPD